MLKHVYFLRALGYEMHVAMNTGNSANNAFVIQLHTC